MIGEAERMQYPRGYQLKSQMKSQNIAIAYGMLSCAAHTKNSTMKINTRTIREL